MSASFADYLALTGFLLTAATWLAAGITSHVLYYAFARRFPDLAKAAIPLAHIPIAHPKKYLYLLSKDFRAVIVNQPDLLRLRRWVIVLSIAGVAMPIALFLSLLAFAFFES